MFNKLKYLLHNIRENVKIILTKNMKFNLKSLGYSFDIDEVFSNKKILNCYNKDFEKISELNLNRFKGGINIGDGKALYFLIMHVKPNKILEVGTHVGSSSSFITSAMQNYYNNNIAFISIDKKDVNSNRHYKVNELSAYQKLTKLNISPFFKFLTVDSLKFLKSEYQNNSKYDLIFLDGNHSSSHVYYEISASLNILNNGGIIIIHDYFPKGRYLWKDNFPILGPYLAVKKIIKLNDNLLLKHLDCLPWKTKQNSNKTSLALLFQKKN